MKLIQVNTWLGYLLYPLLHLVEEEKPDIVCAQEILSSDDELILLDNINTHLTIKKLFPYSFFSPTHKFKVLGSEVELGNAIYSRFPISEERVTFVNGSYEINHSLKDLTRNVRNIQSCSVALPGTAKINIANHHGYHEPDPLGSEKSVACMQRVIEHLQQLEGPLVFCGDFNLSPESKPVKLLNESLSLNNLTASNKISTTLSEAFRIKNLAIACDYIYTSSDISVKEFTVSDRVVSDHKPLILEFTI